MRRCVTTVLCVFAAQAWGQAMPATPPDTMMKNVTQEVVEALRRHPAAPKPGEIVAVVDAKLKPLFDFRRMASLAMGASWPGASAPQQEAIIAEFSSLLMRAYARALEIYREQDVEFKPMKPPARDGGVLVRSEVRRRGVDSIPIDYGMAPTPGGWKIFDVRVAGVSLVTIYREEFAAVVRERGVDGLIKALQDKNKGVI